MNFSLCTVFAQTITYYCKVACFGTFWEAIHILLISTVKHNCTYNDTDQCLVYSYSINSHHPHGLYQHLRLLTSLQFYFVHDMMRCVEVSCETNKEKYSNNYVLATYVHNSITNTSE